MCKKRNNVRRNSMSKYFEELEKGLKEAIQIEKGELKGKKRYILFTNKEVFK